MFKNNRTIYFDSTLNVEMISGLNSIFKELGCLEIINYGDCFPSDHPDYKESPHDQHITVEEMYWHVSKSRDRMDEFLENEKLKWPEKFTKPGVLWLHDHKQNMFPIKDFHYTELIYKKEDGEFRLYLNSSKRGWHEDFYTFSSDLSEEVFEDCFVDVGPSIFLFDLFSGCFRGYGCWLPSCAYFYSVDGFRMALDEAFKTPSLAIVGGQHCMTSLPNLPEWAGRSDVLLKVQTAKKLMILGLKSHVI